jgi:hypothetical protein
MVKLEKDLNLRYEDFNKGHRYIYYAVIFAVAATISDLTQDFFNFNFPLLRYFLFFLAEIFLISGIINTFNYKFGNLLNIVVLILFITIIVSLFKGLPKIRSDYQNYLFFKKLISGELFVLSIPFLILSNPNLVLYKKLFNFFYNLTLWGILIVPLVNIIFTKNPSYGIEVLSRIFTSSGSVILLTSIYHKKKTTNLIYLSIIITLLFLAFFARRNMILYLSSVIFIGIYINLIIKKNNILVASLLFILYIFVISCILYLFQNYFTLVIDRFSTGFDSRENVVDEFFSDFNKTPLDWVYGRGLFSEYSSESTSMFLNKESRDGIENGYLNHILIGGWLYLGSLIILSLRAIYLGFFKSKNILSKAFAAIILIYFVDMVGFGLPTPNIKYIIIFISISACYSNWLRGLPDDIIKSIIKL